MFGTGQQNSLVCPVFLSLFLSFAISLAAHRYPGTQVDSLEQALTHARDPGLYKMQQVNRTLGNSHCFVYWLWFVWCDSCFKLLLS